MKSLIRNSIKFIITIFCFLLVSNNVANCVEFELLYAKPSPNPFFTSKGSKNIAIVNYDRIMLIEPNNGNIIFIKTMGRSSITGAIPISRADFVTIDDRNNRLYFGYKESREGYRVDVYDTQNKLLLKRLSLKPDTILISDISPDNKYVVVIDNHYNTRVYDLETDSLVFNAQQEIDKYFLIYYAKFSSDGKRMALLGATKIFIYNLENKKIEKEINAINYHVHRVVFSNADSYLLRYNYGSSVEVFDLATGEKFRTFEHTGKPGYATLTDNDSILISGAMSTVYFWDFNKGKIIDSLDRISKFALLKLDNREYLVGWMGHLISLWDIGTRLFYKTIVRKAFMYQFVARGSYFIGRLSGKNFVMYNTITGTGEVRNSIRSVM